MSSILSNSSLSLAAEVTDKIKTIKDKNYQISMRCRRFSKWQHIDTIGSCIDLFWLFHRFAINLYISRTSDKMNMLIKREKWRGEDKISQRDRRNKKNERNTKEQETGSSIIAGCWTNSPQRTKKNKNRYKFHFVFYPSRNSVTSPTRGPFPSAVALLFVRRRIGNGRRTRIILLVAAVKTIPLSCLVELNWF